MTEQFHFEGSGVDTILINKLRELGPDNPEARALLLEWTHEQEQEAAAIGTSKATIELNLKRGRIYLAANLIENARENFQAVLLQAVQENSPDLEAEALSALDSLDELSQ